MTTAARAAAGSVRGFAAPGFTRALFSAVVFGAVFGAVDFAAARVAVWAADVRVAAGFFARTAAFETGLEVRLLAADFALCLLMRGLVWLIK